MSLSDQKKRYWLFSLILLVNITSGAAMLTIPLAFGGKVSFWLPVALSIVFFAVCCLTVILFRKLGLWKF